MSNSKRKFYRTIIQIEVLSEEPYSSTDLEKVNDDITNGHQSGRVTIELDSEVMDSKTCVKKLKEQGSDPEFFCLDAHGQDTEDAQDYLNDDEEEGGGIRKLKKD
jgi:hypothetical protein